MFMGYIQIWGIIMFSMTVPGHLVEGSTNEVKKMIDNPVIGKRYSMYKNPENWTLAKEMCEKSGYELVQLPTREEQEWVQNNLAGVLKYWVGATKVGNEKYWKVPNGKILVDSKRLFSESFDQLPFTAHEEHLHDSFERSQNHIICQQEYSKKEDTFEKLNGEQNLWGMIKQFKGGKFRCASECMMSVECKVFLLDFLKGYCHLYRWFRETYPNEAGIDCNSSSMGCFTRL